MEPFCHRRKDLENPGEALAIALYWFAGGYIAAWWTLLATQAGLIGIVIGLVLYLWTRAIEDQGGKIPPLLGCALLAPPLSLLLFGAVIWAMNLPGLL
jgi:hypothetical protein